MALTTQAAAVAPACPIRIISIRLAGQGRRLPRLLFLDGEGQISAAPHWLPREQTPAAGPQSAAHVGRVGLVM
jgi:hypothetical protein